jgi:CheY-like chemotaxis protein
VSDERKAEPYRPLVLIVDDDQHVSLALERSIKHLGYRVRVASDGAAGFEEALRTDPAVVLSDVHMPGMDGHALLRRLVSSGARASVILMSGRGELDDAIGALREGAVDYLKKPWRPDDLAAALDRAIALHDAYRDLSSPPAPTREASPEPLEVAAGTAVDASDLIERVTASMLRGEVALPAASPDLERLRNHFPMAVPALKTLNARICRFSVARALAMRGIAEAAELDSPLDREQCFSTGLWLDVGASFLLSQIAAAMERQGAGVADSVKMMAAVSAHHARVGATLVEHWGAAAEVVALVRDHHAGSPTVPSGLWCAAALAGAVAVRLTGFGDPTGERDLSAEALARCAYTLGVGDTALRRLSQSLEDELRNLASA